MEISITYVKSHIYVFVNLKQEAIRAAQRLSAPRLALLWLRCYKEMDEILQRCPDLWKH